MGEEMELVTPEPTPDQVPQKSWEVEPEHSTVAMLWGCQHLPA